FALQTSDLSHVLPGEFQPDACAHVVRFLDDDHAEMLQATEHRLDILAGLDPGAATSLHQTYGLNGKSGSSREFCLAYAGQSPPRSDHASGYPYRIAHAPDLQTARQAAANRPKVHLSGGIAPAPV